MAEEKTAKNKTTKKNNSVLIGIIAGAVVLIAVVIVLIFSLGGKSDSIVGSWKYDGYLDYTYEFKEDGTCTYSTMTCKYTVDGNNVEILYDGWSEPLKGTFEGNKLNVKDSFDNDTIYIKQ